jgi:Glucosamine 6-phosphate synthetase, contains amidotransferase and phosphosugar isomerase domains
MTEMLNEILEQPEVLSRCYNTNRENIISIVKKIKERNINSVVIAARGTSDHAGIYGKYIIECETGIPVSLASPSVYTVYNKKMKLENSLVIGISQSGKAADVLEVLKNARECGSVTISITNDVASPLAHAADVHLFCDAGLEKSVAATKTCSSEMYILAQMVAEWSGCEELGKELLEIPEKLTEVFSEMDAISEKIERYRFINECFVLARGINYPVAMEAALKIQETAYVRAKAYATSDFYHGPFAMIEKDMPVIVYAPNGPTLKDTMEMVEKLKKNEAEVVVISNNEEMLELGDSSFRIPQTSNDLISPFYNVVIAQLFACNLSLIKGLNPDTPRSLKKVTITK